MATGKNNRGMGASRSRKPAGAAGGGRGVKKAGGLSRRSRVVLSSLLGSMSVVGGLLFLLDRTPASAESGRTFTPLMAAVGSDSIEVVFNTRAPVVAGKWKAIVIHDSGAAYGNADSLDRQAKGHNLRGLGYHFVIGNGNGMDDGELYVGPRWLDQLPGAHATGKDGDWYNRNAIGICVVGDGDRREPSATSMARLVRLVRAIQQECKIPAGRVYLHSEIAPTRSPGRLFPAAAFRSQLIATP